ncbi:hypothetical protein AMJ52_01515 [candidate division TA06 bacterium DG_78]|uniref:Uncharacterized protein n=1 Tax=candidate division TA06 bacterium DG_78 TaxID=1703772 RepID=A0A0S7YHY9_UNCT6|nr:MAG: hypothetical protein AMJ52_01515 [candidate division TA06 bacterium DG_78]
MNNRIKGRFSEGLSDNELIKDVGLEGEEYGGLKREFYEKSTVVAALRRMVKMCIEICGDGNNGEQKD